RSPHEWVGLGAAGDPDGQGTYRWVSRLRAHPCKPCACVRQCARSAPRLCSLVRLKDFLDMSQAARGLVCRLLKRGSRDYTLSIQAKTGLKSRVRLATVKPVTNGRVVFSTFPISSTPEASAK